MTSTKWITDRKPDKSDTNVEGRVWANRIAHTVKEVEGSKPVVQVNFRTYCENFGTLYDAWAPIVEPEPYKPPKIDMSLRGSISRMERGGLYNQESVGEYRSGAVSVQKDFEAILEAAKAYDHSTSFVTMGSGVGHNDSFDR